MSRVRNLVDFTTLTHDFDGDGALDLSSITDINASGDVTVGGNITVNGTELRVDTLEGVWTKSVHQDPYYGGDANNLDLIKDHAINLNGLKINPLPEAGWNSSTDPAGDMYQRPDRWPGAIIYDFEGSQIAENQHSNAKIVMAPALNGTIGIPMITWYYRDDGAEINPVSLPTEELANEYNHPNGEYRAFWSQEISGTAAAIQPWGRNGSVFEWFWDQDNVPFGRLSTTVGTNDRGSRIEFGSGGGGSVNPGLLPNDESTWPYADDESVYEPDMWISRDESNLVTIKVNNKLVQRWKDEHLALIDDTKLVFENSSGGWATIYSEGSPGNNMRLRLDGDVVITGDLVNNAGVSAFASGGSGGGLDTYDLSDADAADLTSSGVGFNLGTTNFPTGVQYGQTLTITGNGDTQWQITSGYGDDAFHMRAGNPENSGGSWGTWKQIASRDYVDTQVGSVGSGGLAGFLTVEQNAAQNFTADVDTLIEFGNAPVDTASGWDAVNNYYVVPASLNGAAANITLTTEMNGGVASGSLMELRLQYSNNGGVNWASLSRDAGIDFYGTKTLVGLLQVQTGTIIRATAKFLGNNRVSWGNSGVNMRISFTS